MMVIVAVCGCLFGAHRYNRETKPPRLWTGWLRSNVPAHREMAAHELGEMGENAEMAVADLARTLVIDDDRTVRRQAVWSLARIVNARSADSTIEVATAALITALDDPDGFGVGQLAAETLLHIHADDRVVVPAFIKAAKNRDVWVRTTAIQETRRERP